MVQLHTNTWHGILHAWLGVGERAEGRRDDLSHAEFPFGLQAGGYWPSGTPFALYCTRTLLLKLYFCCCATGVFKAMELSRKYAAVVMALSNTVCLLLLLNSSASCVLLTRVV